MPRDDAERLSALFDAHAAPVWRYVVHLTGDRTGADDVVQETLLRAWRTPRILEQDPATTRSWMFTVARNLVIDCCEIDFIDSAGLQVMVRAHKEAQAQGGTVTVRRPSAFTLRLLQTVGLDTVLIVDGLPEPDSATVD